MGHKVQVLVQIGTVFSSKAPFSYVYIGKVLGSGSRFWFKDLAQGSCSRFKVRFNARFNVRFNVRFKFLGKKICSICEIMRERVF